MLRLTTVITKFAITVQHHQVCVYKNTTPSVKKCSLILHFVVNLDYSEHLFKNL